MTDAGMASTFVVILEQCSPALFEVALKKVHGFISGRIMETKVSGKIAAGLCRSLCRVNPVKALPVFLPEAIANLNRLIKDTTLKEERLDNELMFNLLIMAEVVKTVFKGFTCLLSTISVHSDPWRLSHSLHDRH